MRRRPGQRRSCYHRGEGQDEAVPLPGALDVGGAAGGIIGALTESGVPESDAHVYAEGVRRGGTLVTARVADELARSAEQILSQSRSVDLVERRRDYEAGGWTGFDPDADDYTADEIERDRARDVNRI